MMKCQRKVKKKMMQENKKMVKKRKNLQTIMKKKDHQRCIVIIQSPNLLRDSGSISRAPLLALLVALV